MNADPGSRETCSQKLQALGGPEHLPRYGKRGYRPVENLVPL